MQSLQRAVLLRDEYRWMIGKKDATRSDANAARYVGQLTDDHGCRTAGDRLHAMMLGYPVASISEFVGKAGKIQRVTKGLLSCCTFDERHCIQYRERHVVTLQPSVIHHHC